MMGGKLDRCSPSSAEVHSYSADGPVTMELLPVFGFYEVYPMENAGMYRTGLDKIPDSKPLQT